MMSSPLNSQIRLIPQLAVALIGTIGSAPSIALHPSTDEALCDFIINN